MALTAKQQTIYNKLVKDKASNAQVAKQFNVKVGDVTKFLKKHNLTAPSEMLLNENPLGANAQTKFNKAIADGKTVADLAAEYGVSEAVVRGKLKEHNLQDPGNPLDKASNVERALKKSQDVVDAGGIYTLPDALAGIYSSAKARGLTSHDLASDYTSRGILGITSEDIDTLLGNAGLNLDPRAPFKEGGAGPTDPALNPPAKDGPPDIQPGGVGIYGTSGDNLPANVSGEAPRHPGLRGIFRQGRRANSPGYKGQTDTILTSGQGLTDKPLTDRKVLLGS